MIYGQRYLIYQDIGDVIPEDKGKWFYYDTWSRPDSDVGGFKTEKACKDAVNKLSIN